MSQFQPYLKIGLKTLLEIYEKIKENKLLKREEVWKYIGIFILQLFTKYILKREKCRMKEKKSSKTYSIN